MTLVNRLKRYAPAGAAAFLGLLVTATAATDTREDAALPLEGSTETLSFETSEGTWMSLDVTPDGTQMVFELLGDLYEMPLSGGEATRLTSGIGYDSMPRVSPNGRWIAFVSDRDGDDNLWIAKSDGSTPRKLSSESFARLVSPAWTPDSQYVAVTVGTARGVKVKMFHVEGGKGLTLESIDEQAAVNGVGLAFSPEGTYVYFTEPASERGAFPGGQIVRMDRHTGEVVRMTQGEGGGVRPLISPNGRWLVYLSRFEADTGIRLRDLVSGEDRMLAWPIQRDAQEAGRLPSRDYYPGYAFTPDSRALIVNTGGGFERINIEDGSRAAIAFNATVALDIGPDLTAPYRIDQGPVRPRIVHDPRFAPDGSRVAASILTKIYLMDAEEGAQPTRLTRGDDWEFKPVWSPDGRWIAYVTWSMNDGGHIWRMRANGRGRPEKLTEHAAFYTDLAFRPDSERIVAMRGNAYQRHQTFSEFTGLGVRLDLVSLPADGGALDVIVAAKGARTPHFGPEADRVYLYDEEDGLISLKFDGTDRRTHLKVEVPRGNRGGEEPPMAEAVRISPDGRHALVLAQKQIWLMPVPATGAATPSVAIRAPSVPAVKLTSIGADFFGWGDGGQTIRWAIGDTLYSRPLASIEWRADDSATSDAVASGDDSGEESGEDSATDSSDSESQAVDIAFLEDDETVASLKMTIEVPRATPERTSVLLTGANIITMKGESTAEMATVLEDYDVWIHGSRIRMIAPTGTIAPHQATDSFDMSGMYIVPGFIDTHAHWEFRTGDVLEPQNWSLVANLAYGVTAGLDVQTNHKDYFAYQDLVDTGQSLGQRAFMTGPGIFGNTDFQSYAETYAYLKRYRDHYRTRNIKAYLTGSRKQRQWVVQASKKLGLMPTTEGGGDMRLDMTHAIDGMHGNEHNLPIAPIYKDVIELYARTKTAYTPTLLVQYNGISAVDYFFTREQVHDDPKLNRFYPKNRLDEMARRRSNWALEDEFSVDDAAAAAAALQRAGGLVGVGGHGELQGLGYHWEMWAYAMGGMTPAEILRAATIDGARIIGIDQDLGSIEADKLADMVVLAANPLEDIRNSNSVRYVVKDGVLYDGNTLDQLWPAEKPLAPFWWWDETRR